MEDLKVYNNNDSFKGKVLTNSKHVPLSLDQAGLIAYQNVASRTFMPQRVPDPRYPYRPISLTDYHTDVSLSNDTNYIEILITAIRTNKGFSLIENLKAGEIVKLTIKREDIVKLSHEMIALNLTDLWGTDIEFKKVLPEYNGPFKLLTADYLHLMNNDLIIVDYARSDVRSLNTTFEIKVNKYTTASTDILDKLKDYKLRTFVGAVIVSNLSVYSNLNLNQDMIDSVIFAKKLGDSIYSQILNSGLIIYKTVDEEDDMRKEIKVKITESANIANDYNKIPKGKTAINPEFLDKMKLIFDNPGYTAKVVNKYWPETQAKLGEELIKSSRETIEAEVGNYKKRIKEVSEVLGHQEKVKPISIFPCFKFDDLEVEWISESVLSKSDRDAIIFAQNTLEEEFDINDPLMRVWISANRSVRTGIGVFEDKVPVFHQPTTETKTWVKNLTKERNVYHRVFVDLDYEARVYLAGDGVQAKKMFKEGVQEVVDKYKNSKSVLHLEDDTDDVKRCMNNGFWNFMFSEKPSVQLWNNFSKQKEELSQTDRETFGEDTNRDSTQFVKTMEMSNFGNWTFILHRIIEELNYSLSQYTDKDFFVMKQIDRLPVFLLIKTTSPDKHIFFSILFCKKGFTDLKVFGRPFRKVYKETQSFLLFDFVSMQRHKISHAIGTTHRITPFIAMWMEIYRLKLEGINNFLYENVNELDSNNNNSNNIDDITKRLIEKKIYVNESLRQDVIEARRMFSFTVMLFLEMANKTSTDLQQIRYAYMKVCAEGLIATNPLSCLRKCTEMVRSRLHLFCIKQTIENFSIMTTFRPKSIVEESKKLTSEEIKKQQESGFTDGILGLISPESGSSSGKEGNKDLFSKEEESSSTSSDYKRDFEKGYEIKESKEEEEFDKKPVIKDVNNNNYDPEGVKEYDSKDLREMLKPKDDEDEDHREKGMFSEIDFSQFSKKNVSTLKFERLKNFLTGKGIDTFEKALNLSYLSHIHNKDDSSENQAEFQIFRKVIAEELKLRKTDWEKLFSEDVSEDYENHEFSVRFAVNCGHAAARRLTKDLGNNFKDVIREKFFHEMKKKTADDYATYKRSAMRAVVTKVDIRKAKKALNKELKDQKGQKRSVLEGMIEVLQTYQNMNRPLANLPELLKKLISLTGTYAILFRKQQIGGTREIFILDVFSRLCISFSETLCTVINRELDCEMLTKGDMKLMRSTEHLDKISASVKDPDRDVVTSIDSGDCTTWAQRFIMPVFSAVFRPLMDDELWSIVNAILNLHENKILELPPFLLSKFVLDQKTKSMDPGMEECKDQFLGRVDRHDLLEEHSKLLHNKSNMEQGILHEQSSTIHACLKYLMKEVNQNLVFQELIKVVPSSSFAFKRTDKVSSDDFSTVRSLIFNHKSIPDSMIFTILKRIAQMIQKSSSPNMPKNKISETLKKMQKIKEEISQMDYKEYETVQDIDRARTMLRSYMKKFFAFTLTRLSLLEERMMKLLTIKQSEEKSTIASLNYIEEFNSTWILSNTILSPKIKFFYGATCLKPLSNFYNKINTLYDLRKQMVENGSSQLSAAIVQECQFSLHYITLGATGIRQFNEFKNLIIQKPTVCYGYFLKEPDVINGIFGFDYTHYMACKNSNLYSRSEYMNYAKDDLEFNENGLASIKTYLLLGQATRYNDFLKSIQKTVTLDWRERIKEDPSILYRKPMDDEEVLIRIMKKAHTPSSADAFSFLSTNKLFASSVYALTFPCVTRKINQFTSEIKIEKQSLIGVLNDFQISDKMFSEQELSIMFPSRLFYDDITEIVTNSMKMRLIEGNTNQVNRFIVMSIPKVAVLAPATLVECCKWKWFPWMGKKSPNSILEYSWEVWTTMFPWLSESYTTTLERGPMKSDISLYEFITSMNPSKRSFKVLTRGRRKNDLKSTIASIVKNGYDLSGKLEAGSNVQTSNVSRDHDILVNVRRDLKIISESPASVWRKLNIILESLETHSERMNLLRRIHTKPTFGKKFVNLIIMMVFASWTSINLDEETKSLITLSSGKRKLFAEILPELKGGVYGRFTERQIFDVDKQKYTGNGEFTGFIDEMPVVFSLVDHNLRLIKVKNMKDFQSNRFIVRDLIKDLKLTTTAEPMLKARIGHGIEWYDITTAKMTRAPILHSVPVIEQKELQVENQIFENSDLYLDLVGNQLRLMLRAERARSSTGFQRLKTNLVVASVHIDSHISKGDNLKTPLSIVENNFDFIKPHNQFQESFENRDVYLAFVMNRPAEIDDLYNYSVTLFDETKLLTSKFFEMDQIADNQRSLTGLESEYTYMLDINNMWTKMQRIFWDLVERKVIQKDDIKIKSKRHYDIHNDKHEKTPYDEEKDKASGPKSVIEEIVQTESGPIIIYHEDKEEYREIEDKFHKLYKHFSNAIFKPLNLEDFDIETQLEFFKIIHTELSAHNEKRYLFHFSKFEEFINYNFDKFRSDQKELIDIISKSTFYYKGKLRREFWEEYDLIKEQYNSAREVRFSLREAFLSRVEYQNDLGMKTINIKSVNDSYLRAMLLTQKNKGNLVFNALEILSTATTGTSSVNENRIDITDEQFNLLARDLYSMNEEENTADVLNFYKEYLMDEESNASEFYAMDSINADAIQDTVSMIDSISQKLLKNHDYMEMLSHKIARPYVYFCSFLDSLLVILNKRRKDLSTIINHFVWSGEHVDFETLKLFIQLKYPTMDENSYNSLVDLVWMCSVLLCNDLKTSHLSANSLLSLELNQMRSIRDENNKKKRGGRFNNL